MKQGSKHRASVLSSCYSFSFAKANKNFKQPTESVAIFWN